MNKAEQSKRAISEAMLRLMKDREYNKITLQNIVDEAGVSRMAFYRNFESKEDVLRYWLKGVTDRFVAESGAWQKILCRRFSTKVKNGAVKQGGFWLNSPSLHHSRRCTAVCAPQA